MEYFQSLKFSNLENSFTNGTMETWKIYIVSKAAASKALKLTHTNKIRCVRNT